MTKIKPIALVEALSGKVCRHSNIYFATHQRTGKVYSRRLCMPSTKPATPAQLEIRAKFSATLTAVNNWLTKNQPTTDLPNGSEEYQKVRSAFEAQHNIDSWRAFLFKRMFDSSTDNGGNYGG